MFIDPEYNVEDSDLEDVPTDKYFIPKLIIAVALVILFVKAC